MRWPHCMYVHLFSLYFKINLWPYFSLFLFPPSLPPSLIFSDPQQWPKCREKSPLTWREDGFTNVTLQDAAKYTPKALIWKPTAESIQVCTPSSHPQHTHVHTHMHAWRHRSLWEIRREESLQTKTNPFTFMGTGSIHGFYFYISFIL